MNLAIEYLVRTGVIRKFFQTPCSLCLENWLNCRKVLYFEKSDSRTCKVTEWSLNSLGEHGLPERHNETSVPADQIFTNCHAILPGEFCPIPYHEEPIDNCLNRYNHPMDEDSYRFFFDNHLNSHRHKRSREAWLWKSFRALHIKKPLLPLRLYEEATHRIVHYETLTVEAEYPELWRLWKIWRKKFLCSGEVATELIFQRVYENRRSTSSSSVVCV